MQDQVLGAAQAKFFELLFRGAKRLWLSRRHDLAGSTR